MKSATPPTARDPDAPVPRRSAEDRVGQVDNPAGTPEPGAPAAPPEIGGRRDGTDPTRFGDWEKGGRCIDF